ncbi:MAG: tetratricopeptide repeat protein, partial [Anaerolineales bacterium]|nr:tetratricopeptide repeat protein [Anaerolineales bacterium]
MRTILISKGLPMWVSSLIVLGFLISCGAPQEELDATATQLAGDIYATQTAQVPTTTNTPTARVVAEEHYLRGEDFRLEKKWELAIEEFTQAISLDPDYAEAYLNRGLAYYGIFDEESAIADFEKAIELGLDPQTPQMFTNRGRAFAIMEDYDLAITDFDQAIALDPEFVEAYVRRGNIYAFYKDDFDLANADFEQAITLDPEYSLAYAKRGYAFMFQEDYESAIEDLNRAI